MSFLTHGRSLPFPVLARPAWLPRGGPVIGFPEMGTGSYPSRGVFGSRLIVSNTRIDLPYPVSIPGVNKHRAHFFFFFFWRCQQLDLHLSLTSAEWITRV